MPSAPPDFPQTQEAQSYVSLAPKFYGLQAPAFCFSHDMPQSVESITDKANTNDIIIVSEDTFDKVNHDKIPHESCFLD